MKSEAPEDGELYSAGGDFDSIRASVQIVGDHLHVDRVSEMLGVEPTFAAEAGEVRADGVRQPTGVWTVELGSSQEWILADAIDALLDRLPGDLTVWQRLSDDFDCTLSVGIFMRAWNRGGELPARVLKRISERSLALSLDVYANGPAETDGSPW